MSEAMTAQCSPPPSEPAKRWFLRPSAIGRIERSTTLESNLDAAVVEEAGEPVPARERVADRRGDGRLAGDGGELGFQPQTQSIDERLATPLPRLAAFVGGQAANIGFDGIQRSDADQRLGGDRCRRLGLDVVELPPHMAPAEGELARRRPRRGRVAAVAVDLQRCR